jgi:DNA polymerase V
MTFMSSSESKRGGFRPGSGRPRGSGKHGEQTVAIRVPLSLASNLDKYQSLLALIEDYKNRSADASPTSPRWEQMRAFLSDFAQLEKGE